MKPTSQKALPSPLAVRPSVSGRWIPTAILRVRHTRSWHSFRCAVLSVCLSISGYRDASVMCVSGSQDIVMHV